MKNLFSSVLEELLQCELDEKLGYNKHEWRPDEIEGKILYAHGTPTRDIKEQVGGLYDWYLSWAS